MIRAILMHPADDVAVLVEPVEAGTAIGIVGRPDLPGLVAASPLPLGHKVAVRDLPADWRVRKSGEVIGRTVAPVRAGQHVHVHNLASLRAVPPSGAQPPAGAAASAGDR